MEPHARSSIGIHLLSTIRAVGAERVEMGERDNRTLLSNDMTKGLGEIAILHPLGTFALTPASMISIEAIANNQSILSGIGTDWGSGSGCLSIVATKVPTVHHVFGLEVSEANIEIARKNAALNGVENKVTFIVSDSYTPHAQKDRERIETLTGQVNFILANPPSSEGDDGFGYRRVVLRGARKFLAQGGLVLLSISYQYGWRRIEQLSGEIPGFVYGGILASTDWVPFDLSRSDLLHCLKLYAEEENRGGLEYTFRHPERDESLDAQSALAHFRRTEQSPLSKWQTHLFRYDEAAAFS
jgi:16S rRNA G966 N2-methylase RsmD